MHIKQPAGQVAPHGRSRTCATLALKLQHDCSSLIVMLPQCACCYALARLCVIVRSLHVCCAVLPVTSACVVLKGQVHTGQVPPHSTGRRRGTMAALAVAASAPALELSEDIC